MCEFKVFIKGEKVADDVVYAKQEKRRVILRDIIGRSHTITDVKIIEVDVTLTRLILDHKILGD
jgi:predicted RNA-binding protein